jgi:hypothetical protein
MLFKSAKGAMVLDIGTGINLTAGFLISQESARTKGFGGDDIAVTSRSSNLSNARSLEPRIVTTD